MKEHTRFALGFLTGVTVLGIPFIPWIVMLAPILLVALLVLAYKEAKAEQRGQQ